MLNRRVLTVYNRFKFSFSVVLLTALIYACWVLPVMFSRQPLPMDTYRDIAYARGILEGNPVWADQALKGEFLWYPPLNPLTFALLSRLSGVDIFKLYAYSALFILFFSPLLYYLFLKAIIPRHLAWGAVLLIPLMPWLSTHLFSMPMPSIHSFVVLLLILGFFMRALRNGLRLREAWLLGIAMGLAFLHHSLSALILYASIFLFFVVNLLFCGKKYAWSRLMLVLGLPLLFWSVYLLPNLFKPRLNSAPLHYVAQELYNGDFALFIPTKYTFVITLVLLVLGTGLAVRRHREDGFMLLLCLLGVSGAGQALGYLVNLGYRFPETVGFLRHLPFIIPHEFQWYFQFFSLPFLVLGMAFTWRIQERFRWFPVLAFPLLVLFLFPAYRQLPERLGQYAAWPGERQAEESFYLRWLRENTSLDDVCLCSDADMAYFKVQPYTARKVVAHFAGHMNFNISFWQRERAKQRLLHETDFAVFKELAQKYEVTFAVLERRRLSAERFRFFSEHFALRFVDHRADVYIFALNEPPLG